MISCANWMERQEQTHFTPFPCYSHSVDSRMSWWSLCNPAVLCCAVRLPPLVNIEASLSESTFSGHFINMSNSCSNAMSFSNSFTGSIWDTRVIIRKESQSDAMIYHPSSIITGASVLRVNASVWCVSYNTCQCAYVCVKLNFKPHRRDYNTHLKMVFG